MERSGPYEAEEAVEAGFLPLDVKSWGYRQWIPVTAAMMVLVMFLSVGGAAVFEPVWRRRASISRRQDGEATPSEWATRA